MFRRVKKKMLTHQAKRLMSGIYQPNRELLLDAFSLNGPGRRHRPAATISGTSEASIKTPQRSQPRNRSDSEPAITIG